MSKNDIVNVFFRRIFENSGSLAPLSHTKPEVLTQLRSLTRSQTL